MSKSIVVPFDNKLHLKKKVFHFNSMTSEMMSVTGSKNSTWNLENGYNDTNERFTDHYPYRVFRVGEQLSVRVHVFKQDIDYTCTLDAQGFKLLLHDPREMLKFSVHFYPWKQKVTIAVKPNLFTTSSSLRYKETIRDVFF